MADPTERAEFLTYPSLYASWELYTYTAFETLSPVFGRLRRSSGTPRSCPPGSPNVAFLNHGGPR